MPDFPRATRWDVLLLLRQLADSTGIELFPDGRCRGGQFGASYVRWADGHRSVLTARPAGQLAAARQAERLVTAAREAGIPAPRYEFIAELPAATAIVQELLHGAPLDEMSRVTAESMVEVNRRCRGLLAGRTEFPAPSLYLLTDGPGYCLHAPMASYDRSTARLLAAIEEAGAALPEHLDGGDLAHCDFHPEDVLVDASGSVTGVVDWDGACRSDGVLDLMTLRFDLARRAPDLGRWLGGLLRDQASAELRLACWAHMSLRLVDWAIGELTDAEVTTWVAVANEIMP
jgi:hypothetical protein